MISRVETYSFKDFREVYNSDKERSVDLRYAFLLANPIAQNIKLPDLSQINPLQIVSTPGSLESLGTGISNLNQFLFYFTHPIDLLKIIAQACVDLGFATASIVAILALCMYVFTGCKDNKPLQYVGLSVACYYIIAVIFNAFIVML